jgi:CBS domain containing-hemolysin-like protein
MSAILNMIRDLLIRSGLLRSGISEEQLEQVIDAGTKSGAIDKTEHELMKSILQFSDITAKEIMVPRPDIVALDMAMPREQIVRRVIEEGYSRLPVYSGTIDTIIGVVYSKDLLSLLEHRDLILLQDILRPPFFVPESMKVSTLLRTFQQSKVHLAIVLDEFGGTEGLITIEDIIEEIVGDILDEYDEAGGAVIAATDGTSLVDAAITIGDFNQQFHADVPEAPDYETLAGYLHKVSGKLPEQNEEIRTPLFVFTIVSKSARRIRQVRVKRLPPSDVNGEQEG